MDAKQRGEGGRASVPRRTLSPTVQSGAISFSGGGEGVEREKDELRSRIGEGPRWEETWGGYEGKRSGTAVDGRSE